MLVQAPSAQSSSSYGPGPVSVPPASTGSSARSMCGPAKRVWLSPEPELTTTGRVGICLSPPEIVRLAAEAAPRRPGLHRPPPEAAFGEGEARGTVALVPEPPVCFERTPHDA